MNLIERLKAPTPKFFRVLRNVGIALAAAGGALLAAPIALPAAVITLAGYITVAASVMTAVSQSAVVGESDGTVHTYCGGGGGSGGGVSDPKN